MANEIEPVEEETTDVALPSEEDQQVDGEEDEEDGDSHVSLAARSLQILALVFVGVAIGLWAGPRLAPHLPKGMAPVAAWLSPQTNASTEALEVLRAETEARLAQLEAGLQREEVETRLSNFQTDIVNPIRDQMTGLTSQLEASDSTAVEARLWAVEGRVEGLVAELESLRSMMGSIAEDGGAITADTAASIAAYRTRIDALQAQINEMVSRQGALTQTIAALQNSTSQQVEEAQLLLEEADETVLTAQNSAAIGAALIVVETALQTGAPFAEALGSITELTGVPIPVALSDAAEGIQTLDMLEESFPQLAHEAIRADLAASKEGGLSGIGSFLRAQVATRSLTPQSGDSADAALSRMEAALKHNELSRVLEEATGLQEAALAEMAGWLTQVETRKAALSGFSAWALAVKEGE